MTPIKGSCLCGAVTFEITGTPLHLTYCHCDRCRKASGLSSAVVMVKAADFRLLTGADQISTYEPPAPWTHKRCFCGVCGSSLGEPLGGHEVFPIAASALDDDPGIRPVLHMNTASKPDWHGIGDGVKQIPGNYGA
ncbi:GFA family protein [Phenylobacterium sp.]|uniref:GFA family protein n=1 Tax=Phenylobacterium sp. TaxID=1871053 RepID=UPI00271E3F57|nr:GFA family protein [Phenylobacterium sp.]MDO8377900.1 GFA family protein [Phenylobacterium sp.]